MAGIPNIYIEYIKKFGYPPKTEHHLQSFSKYYANKTLSYKEVQIIMKNNSIMMTGYLLKESKYLKQFRRRWIVLKSNKLYCFKDEDDAEDESLATEIIDLSIYDKLQRSSIDYPKFRLLSHNNDTQQKSNKKVKPRVFIADSEEIMDKWLHQIKKSRYGAQRLKTKLEEKRQSISV